MADDQAKFKIYNAYFSNVLDALNLSKDTDAIDKYRKRQLKFWHPDNFPQNTSLDVVTREAVTQALSDAKAFTTWVEQKIQEQDAVRNVLQYTGLNGYYCTIHHQTGHYPTELDFRFNTHCISYYEPRRGDMEQTYFALTKIILPKTKLLIESRTFEGACNLNTIDFKTCQSANDEPSITLSSNCFSHCYKLTDINFPINTHFEDRVFAASGYAKVFHYRASFSFQSTIAPLARTLGSPTNKATIVNNIVNHTIIFEDDTISESVCNNTIFNDTQFKNWDAIHHIHTAAFEGAKGNLKLHGITEFRLPISIETIGTNAFKSCDLIPEILRLPPTLTEIGLYAFSNTKLKKVICAPWQHTKFCNCFPPDTQFEETFIPLTYSKLLEFKPGTNNININVGSVSPDNYILADTNNENIFVKHKTVNQTLDHLSLTCYNITTKTLKAELTVNIL